ncbi:MAG: pirin family protein [Thermoplasmata archaeon]|nr:pirin family protein [Thermoplasmata archaeon]
MTDPVGDRIEVVVRPAESIYRASGEIQNGTFRGRWHFSFDSYWDPQHTQFGNLRVFNDDTLSPGSVWPLHPHVLNEVVTYVAAGEFRHEDEGGLGGVLHQGGVQHTTVGSGMYHSEINHRADIRLRFVQLWFFPEALDLPPSVEQRDVERSERTDRWLPLVSPRHPGALPLRADAAVLASSVGFGRTVEYNVEPGRGLYLYVLEGGPVTVGEQSLSALSAAQIRGAGPVRTVAERQAELLLVDVNLSKTTPPRPRMPPTTPSSG